MPELFIKMKNIVLITDVDGTLDYKCRGIDVSVIQSARDYVEAGGSLALATGRAVVSTQKIAQDLHVNTPSILYGGAMIYNFCKKSPIWVRPLSNQIIHLVKEIIDMYPTVALLVYTDRLISILSGNYRLWTTGIPLECDKRFLGMKIEGDILKLNICGDRESIEQIQNTYFSGSEYYFSFSSRHFAEVVSVEAGKGNAMKALSEIVNIPLDRFIAMGDGLNDLDMLRLAGVSYTLENAADIVKKSTDVVLPHCGKQGAEKGFRLAKKFLQI